MLVQYVQYLFSDLFVHDHLHRGVVALRDHNGQARSTLAFPRQTHGRRVQAAEDQITDLDQSVRSAGTDN
jgi:hypothetical protein